MENFDSEIELLVYVDNLLPEWVEDTTMKKYCDDYTWLTRNWHKLCEVNNTTPKRIVLVSDINFLDESQRGLVMRKLCDDLTAIGYVIRRSGEFIACSKCRKAIPCKEIYNLMKEKGAPVPEFWSDKCTKC